MTKRDLVNKVAAETGLIQSEVATVIQKTFDFIGDELAAGHDLEFRNFGVFEICTRKSRPGRNPKHPEIAVEIPERKVVKFRPGRELKKRILDLDKKES